MFIVNCSLLICGLPRYASRTKVVNVSINQQNKSFPIPGAVYFIGAGPGDPELLTLKAQKLIARADVIIYAGSLVNQAVLSHARPEAETYNSIGMKLDEQIEVMSKAVKKGQSVVRLHTGDPAIYGATLEQMRQLYRREIPYAVVPGVTSAFAAAAALGIELTVPGDTQTVIFSRLSGRTPVPDSEALPLLAAHRSSLVIFLSAGMIARVADELQEAGYTPDTPIAVVFRASWPDELIIRGTLANIAGQVQAAEITHHALIIVSPALKTEAKSEVAQDSHLYGAALAQTGRQPTTAIIALTRNGTQTGRRLQAALPNSILYAPARFVETESNKSITPYTTSVRQTLQSAFQEHDALICIMASGIVVRDLAPLLRSKHTDPAVVVMDERGQHAISLLSGHKGGANELARRAAALLEGTPVLTTASDAQGLPAVDLLGREEGWVINRSEHLTDVSAALVNGETVGVVQEAGEENWQLDPPPANLIRFPSIAALQEASPPAAIIITFRQVSPELLEAIPRSVIYHPPCLAVGVGCNRGTPAEEIQAAIDQTLTEAGLELSSVAQLATIEDKADEAGLLETCDKRNWPLRIFSRREIATVTDLPNPSEWAQRALGVPGVAEPAALLAANSDTLLVEKQKFPNVTVAVSLKSKIENRKSKIQVVGIGPGDSAHLTPAARQAIEEADVIFGYKTYLRLIAGLAPNVPREGSGMRQEVSRVNQAVDQAQTGKRVALISSGDAGVYGMAGLVYEVLCERGEANLPVEIIPGVSALNAAAALLGAPLMTDFAAISLSDQLTPREEILRRVDLAAEADFILCLYNPKGRNRVEPFELTCDILARHRPPETPVGIVRAAYRDKQQVEIITLADLPQAEVNMVTTIIVGNSRTYVQDGKMVTPRGYANKYMLNSSS